MNELECFSLGHGVVAAVESRRCGP
jgi:hypothetical protein